MAPLHGLLLKEPRALEIKRVFMLFSFCGPGQAQENQGRQRKPYHWRLSPAVLVCFFLWARSHCLVLSMVSCNLSDK